MNRDSTPSQTEIEYRQVISHCKALFDKKNKDYGTSWRILRLPSLTDQIFIKAQRIRTLEQNGFSKVGEGIVPEYIGIINYAVMALVQLELGHKEEYNMPVEKALNLYDKYISISESKLGLISKC